MLIQLKLFTFSLCIYTLRHTCPHTQTLSHTTHAHSLTHSHTLTLIVTHSFTHTHFHSYSLIHTLIHSLSHSHTHAWTISLTFTYTHSLTHSDLFPLIFSSYTSTLNSAELAVQNVSYYIFWRTTCHLYSLIIFEVHRLTPRFFQEFIFD